MLTLDALINLTVASVQKGSKAEKQIVKMFGPTVASAVEDAVASGTEKGAKKAIKKASPALEAAYAKLSENGMKAQADVLDARFKKSERKADQAMRQATRHSAQRWEQAETAAEKKRFARELKQQKKLISREDKAQKKMLGRAETAATDRIKLIEEHDERMAKSRTTAMKEGGEQFADVFEKAFDPGSIDASSLVSGLMGGAAGMARAGAGSAAAGGATAAAAGMATAAASIAAVAAPLVALVGVLGKAYGHGKELNKSLFESANAFDMFGDMSYRASDSVTTMTAGLRTLQMQATDLAYATRLSQEETLGITKAFFEAGLQLREFQGLARDGSSTMQAAAESTRTAAMAAYGLGLEVSEVTGFIEKMNRDFGTDLDGFKDLFGDVAGAAQRAGMRTTDFYAAINEASSGMAMYNFRVQDTVGLFEKLVEILGEDMAKQQMGANIFQNMGTQEAYKQSMLGAGRESAVADAQAQAVDVLANMSQDSANAMEAYMTGGAIDIHKLAKAGGSEFRAVLTELSDEEARRVQSLRELSKATQGTGGRAIALGNLSQLGALAAQFEQGSSMFGGKMLNEMGAVERMGYEEVTGVSGEDFRVRANLQERMMGDYEAMQGTEEGRAALDGKSFSEAIVAGLLTSEGDQAKLTQVHWTEVERAALDTLIATRSIADQIGNVITDLLTKIAGGIDVLVGFFGMDKGRSRQVDQMRAFGDAADSLQAGLSETTAELSEKQAELSMTTDEGSKATIREEIAALEARKAGTTGRIGELRGLSQRAGRGESITLSSLISSAGLDTSDPLLRDAGLTQQYSHRRQIPGTGGITANNSRQGIASGGEWETYTVDRVMSSGSASPEEIGLLEDIVAERDAEQGREAERVRRDDELLTATEDGAEDIVKEIERTSRKDVMSKLAAQMEASAANNPWGATSVDASGILGMEEGPGKLQAIMDALNADGRITIAEASLAKALGYDIQATAYDDWIVSDGKVQPFTNKDKIHGWKDGGPLDQMARGGGGNTYNIYGSQEEIYRTLRSMANNTGMV